MPYQALELMMKLFATLPFLLTKQRCSGVPSAKCQEVRPPTGPMNCRRALVFRPLAISIPPRAA